MTTKRGPYKKSGNPRKPSKAQEARSVESFFLANAKPGEILLSPLTDREFTARAAYFKRKITTERIIVVAGVRENPTAEPITKVTIVE